jgi:hypothetical protein
VGPLPELSVVQIVGIQTRTKAPTQIENEE